MSESFENKNKNKIMYYYFCTHRVLRLQILATEPKKISNKQI